MRETFFTAALTFSLMAGGAVAIGSELVRVPKAPAPIATLPAVSVVGQRVAAVEVVLLPEVQVTGKRAASEVVRMPTVVVTGKRPAAPLVAETAVPEAEAEVARGAGRPLTSAGTRAGSFD